MLSRLCYGEMVRSLQVLWVLHTTVLCYISETMIHTMARVLDNTFSVLPSNVLMLLSIAAMLDPSAIMLFNSAIMLANTAMYAS